MPGFPCCNPGFLETELPRKPSKSATSFQLPIAGRGFLRVVDGAKPLSWDDVPYTSMELVRDVTRKHPDLSMNQKSVLKALLERIDPLGRCWPSQKTIASDTGCSISVIKRTLKSLREKEYISTSRKGRSTKSCMYQVAILKIRKGSN